MMLGPSSGVAANRVVAPVIAAPSQLLEDPDQRQLFASGFSCIAGQQLLELSRPSPQLRPRLDVPLVLKRGLPGPQHLANRVPGHLEVPRDLPDRLAFDEVLAPNPANRLHCQHSPSLLDSNRSEQRSRPIFRGSILDADPPAQGVKIARRMTASGGSRGPRCERAAIMPSAGNPSETLIDFGIRGTGWSKFH